MISNERPSPYRDPTFSSNPAKERMEETTLKTGQIQVERKTFVFTLMENARGRFLRLSEEANGKRNTVIIPATGLHEFGQVFDAMVKAEGQLPESTPGNEA